MLLNVTNADYVGDYTLLCSFNNGESRSVDCSPLLELPAFNELKDLKKFMQYAVHRTVFWANGADIAPEWLYEHGAATTC